MKNAEKIEALREWVRSNDEPDFGLFAAGYLKALTEVRDIIDPPKPKWRELVDDARSALLDEFKQPPLPTVLSDLAEIADDENDPRDCLARIVAVAEAQVGDGWQADPERVHPGFWGVAWLLVPLSHEPPDWAVVSDRAAAWLRGLCK